MGKRKDDDIGPLREEWPRIRVVSVKGIEYFQVDGRPEFKRKAFTTLEAARKQASKWENSRTRYGKAGRFLSERDASRFAEALDILRPHGAGMVDAAKHYVAFLETEKLRASSKPTADALQEWIESYAAKDRDVRTRQEIKSVAGILYAGLRKIEVERDYHGAFVEMDRWLRSATGQTGQPADACQSENEAFAIPEFLTAQRLD